MTTFEAISGTVDSRVLEVKKHPGTDGVVIIVNNPGRWKKAITIPAEQAPALALAILETAGIRAGAKSDKALTDAETAARALHGHVNVQRAMAAEAAALEKRNQRRDELALELSGLKRASYAGCTDLSKRAIDRIIELEGKGQSKW